MTKNDIREISHRMGLPTWNKPSFACLSSRIPYGTRIEPDILRRLDEAKRFMKGLGFRQVTEKFKELEYLYTTLDLGGYRMGSMNAVLNRGNKALNG
ncbi:MAG: hypothetical protein ABIA59_02340 [Candidatus Latescibacterota bacterium]